jgi:uncharacterized phage protein (TIGR01671 family)
MSNRKIKFRVWNGHSMEYRVLAGALGHFYVEGMSKKDSACLSDANTIYNEATPLMQFTGLLDKNGKEIWEDDIVKYRKKNRKVSIGEFWDGVDDRVGMFIQDPQIQHRNFGTNKLSSFSSCEVIGNIHANPELLK